MSPLRKLNPAAFADPRPGRGESKRKSPTPTERVYVDTRQVAFERAKARAERLQLVEDLLTCRVVEFVSACGNRLEYTMLGPKTYRVRSWDDRWNEWVECGREGRSKLRAALREAKELPGGAS